MRLRTAKVSLEPSGQESGDGTLFEIWGRSSELSYCSLLRTYLRIAYRTLRKRIGPTLINVIRLAVGLAVCLLIGLWIHDEPSHDRFHPEAERIHRIAVDLKMQGYEFRRASVGAPLGLTLVREAPEVESATRFRFFRTGILRAGEESFPNTRIAFTDSSFFEVFGSFELLHGSRETALDDPDAVVLTASTAERLFGRANVVGPNGRLWRLRGSAPRKTTTIVSVRPSASALTGCAPCSSIPCHHRCPFRNRSHTGIRHFRPCG